MKMNIAIACLLVVNLLFNWVRVRQYAPKNNQLGLLIRVTCIAIMLTTLIQGELIQGVQKNTLMLIVAGVPYLWFLVVHKSLYFPFGALIALAALGGYQFSS